MRTVLAPLAVVFVSAFMPAEAASQTPPAEWVALAQAKAEQFWGGPDCPTVEVVYQTLGQNAIAEAAQGDCRVFVDPAMIRGMSFPILCAVFVHEYGHLVGYLTADGQVHARDPRNVMYPSVDDRNTPRICKEHGRSHRRAYPARTR